MSYADLTNPIFTDETSAREYLEAQRWPNGPVCPHCGSVDENVYKLGGKGHRPGLYACKGCRGHFSVTVGTVYERSHIPLHKWLLATHLMASSKKGISAHQLHRLLGITYKSAWFMAHRIREAMQDTGREPMGGKGKVVEADETYFGNLPPHKAPIRKNPNRPKHGPHHKRAIVTLVERGGKSRSFYAEHAHVDKVAKIVRENVAKESRLHTDTSSVYKKVGQEFDAHEAVNHFKKEFARGMTGVYQHCDERHLHRYLAEFDFRYSNRAALGCSDRERADKALKGIEGKRLTYRRINEEAQPS